ncbi:MAG: hypothetical protein NZZ60_05330 [Bacteroidia bacterium]|nr:hypothetical protein [Bacteroidia bacterium]MCX7652823.1 hypothetical protein [Bacteroidia bacterium]MDW8415931.1 hypothetical protein [Bacteroidia bacterium]
MGRLQRYLRALSETEWSQLLDEMSQTLGKRTVQLAIRLRETLRTLPLTSTEREQAQRIERWIWRKEAIESYEKISLTAPTPFELRLIGAHLLYKKGLVKDAYTLLAPTGSESLVQKLHLDVQKLLWQVQEGELRDAEQTLNILLRLLRQIYADLERQKMEIILSRILREYGGSDLPKVRRTLDKIGKRLKQRRLPEEKSHAYYAERNLRLLYGITRRDPDETEKWRMDIMESAEALPVLLNSWLSLLIEGVDLERITHIVKQINPPLLPQFESIAGHLAGLTLLRYASSGFVRAIIPKLYGYITRLPVLVEPESDFLKAQLFWLSGEASSAHLILTDLRDRNREIRGITRIQIEITYLMLNYDLNFIQNFHNSLLWLKGSIRKFEVASTKYLRQILKNLQTEQSPSTYHFHLAQYWEAIQTNTPSEAQSWKLTIFPDWIAGRSKGLYLWEYRTETNSADPQKAADFWNAISRLFGL